jgi:hypothetical protein
MGPHGTRCSRKPRESVWSCVCGWRPTHQGLQKAWEATSCFAPPPLSSASPPKPVLMSVLRLLQRRTSHNFCCIFRCPIASILSCNANHPPLPLWVGNQHFYVAGRPTQRLVCPDASNIEAFVAVSSFFHYLNGCSALRAHHISPSFKRTYSSFFFFFCSPCLVVPFSARSSAVTRDARRHRERQEAAHPPTASPLPISTMKTQAERRRAVQHICVFTATLVPYLLASAFMRRRRLRLQWPPTRPSH